MATSHKEIAQAFLRAAASGNVCEAYQQHVAPNFKHHNPLFRGDAESLRKGMEENAVTNPNKTIEVQRVVEEGDFVVIHSRVRQNPGELDAALVHIFKFHGDRIVELWDLGQPVPEDSPNENGMF